MPGDWQPPPDAAAFHQKELENERLGEWVIVRGREIYTRTWRNKVQPPAAVVVAVHGFCEHIDRYDHVFRVFAEERNFLVHGYDQRGFGRTGRRGGRLGYMDGWDKVMGDVRAAIGRSKVPGVPVVLGGMIVLNYATFCDESNDVAGIVCSAPAIRIAPESHPYPITVTALRLISRILPTFPHRSNLNPADLCADPQVWWEYQNSKYNLDFGSLACIRDMIDYGDRLLGDSTISRFSKPLLLMHSRSDRITDCVASVEFYGKLTTAKTLRDGSELAVEEGLGHEMHNEKCWRRIAGRWADWIATLAERYREEAQAKGN